jgi:putative aldouronate transport system permease protein
MPVMEREQTMQSEISMHKTYANTPSRTAIFFERLKAQKILWLMILPAILMAIVFSYLPMAGLVLAFKRFMNNRGIWGSPWVGFRNFNVLIQSGVLWRITRNTIAYNLIFLAITQTLQVMMAIFISETAGKTYKKFAQGIMFLPYFVSFVILGAFVYGILNFEVGALNGFLKSLGQPPFDAYMTPWIWPFVILIAHTWKWMGYGTVIFLAATMSISPEHYEAAAVDGASKWQQIRHITIPGIMPTIIICTLLNIGHIMRGQFELYFNIIGMNGHLYELTDVIDTFVFRTIIQNFNVGVGTATGLYQGVFGLILVMVANYLVKHYEEDYALF